MRVLLVTGSLPPMPCGVGDYTHGLAVALAATGEAQVAVLTSVSAGAGTARAYEVLAVMPSWTPRDLSTFLAVVRAWRPDVVHLQLPTQGYGAGRLPGYLPAVLRLRGVRVVQTWHEYAPATGRTVDLALAALRDLPSAVFGRDVVVVRPEFRERMRWWYRAVTYRKRFHLIPNAPAIPRVTLDASSRADVRARWGADAKALLVFFGFLYEHKGIEDALAAMDPTKHHLVIAGGVDEADPYQAALVLRMRAPPLFGHVTLAGFLAPEDAARLLAAADAVVLPFRSGGGSWNTSIKAAARQGTFILTTSATRRGFDAEENAYYARPQDPADLADALLKYAGRRLAVPSALAGPDWPEIAERHLAVYRLGS